MSEFTVLLKKGAKNYPGDLLLLGRFWSEDSMDTLLSHEARGEDLWMAIEV